MDLLSAVQPLYYYNICLPDGTGVYPITEQYSAECGYTVSVLPLPGHVELRASYLSCHADNNVRTNTHETCAGLLWSDN